MKTTIIAIDPSENRYGTVGDWMFAENGDILVTTTKCGNPDSEFLVAIHELIEAYLCKRDGITEEEVNAWDVNNPELDEPGDSKNAPYHRQHAVAMRTEKFLADLMLVDWEKHQQQVENIGNEVDRCIAGVVAGA